MTSKAILPNDALTREIQDDNSQKLSLIECQLTFGDFNFNSLASLFFVLSPSFSPKEARVPAAPKKKRKIIFFYFFNSINMPFNTR